MDNASPFKKILTAAACASSASDQIESIAKAGSEPLPPKNENLATVFKDLYFFRENKGLFNPVLLAIADFEKPGFFTKDEKLDACKSYAHCVAEGLPSTLPFLKEFTSNFQCAGHSVKQPSLGNKDSHSIMQVCGESSSRIRQLIQLTHIIEELKTQGFAKISAAFILLHFYYNQVNAHSQINASRIIMKCLLPAKRSCRIDKLRSVVLTRRNIIHPRYNLDNNGYLNHFNLFMDIKL